VYVQYSTVQCICTVQSLVYVQYSLLCMYSAVFSVCTMQSLVYVQCGL
jgi:hypothetical protein